MHKFLHPRRAAGLIWNRSISLLPLDEKKAVAEIDAGAIPGPRQPASLAIKMRMTMARDRETAEIRAATITISAKQHSRCVMRTFCRIIVGLSVLVVCACQSVVQQQRPPTRSAASISTIETFAFGISSIESIGAIRFLYLRDEKLHQQFKIIISYSILLPGATSAVG